MALLEGLSYQVIIELKNHFMMKQNIHIFVTHNILVFFFTECTISDECASQLKEWLRNNCQPLSQVETNMQETPVYRAKYMRENNWTMDQILRVPSPNDQRHGKFREIIILHVMRMHCL